MRAGAEPGADTRLLWPNRAADGKEELLGSSGRGARGPSGRRQGNEWGTDGPAFHGGLEKSPRWSQMLVCSEWFLTFQGFLFFKEINSSIGSSPNQGPASEINHFPVSPSGWDQVPPQSL